MTAFVLSSTCCRRASLRGFTQPVVAVDDYMVEHEDTMSAPSERGGGAHRVRRHLCRNRYMYAAEYRHGGASRGDCYPAETIGIGVVRPVRERTCTRHREPYVSFSARPDRARPCGAAGRYECRSTGRRVPTRGCASGSVSGPWRAPC